jgi:lipoprotein-anchoring transpeptidase ErfK/SrfK
MPPNDSDQKPRRTRPLLVAAVAGGAAVALAAGAVLWIGADSDRPAAEAHPHMKAVSSLTAAELKKLPEADTYATIKGAPADPRPAAATPGAVVHPNKATPVFAAPGGKPIAKVKPEQLGDTWLPVIARKVGWVQVLLPSKPNGSTGWLPEAGLRKAATPYLVSVHLKSMKLQLFRDGSRVGSWSIGIGKPDTPTPTGRTFLLGSITDEKQKFSPVILPLGAHSKTLDSFGGGPGTVAIHTWPSTNVLGTATSHGCIRVPQEALDELTKVPLGTLVLVDDK